MARAPSPAREGACAPRKAALAQKAWGSCLPTSPVPAPTHHRPLKFPLAAKIFKASAKAWGGALVMAPTWGSPSVAASLLPWE